MASAHVATLLAPFAALAPEIVAADRHPGALVTGGVTLAHPVLQLGISETRHARIAAGCSQGTEQHEYQAGGKPRRTKGHIALAMMALDRSSMGWLLR